MWQPETVGAALKIGRPGRVVRISPPLNKNMAPDGQARHVEEDCRTVRENPVASGATSVVSPLEPRQTFPGMSPSGPVPCHAPNRLVNVAENLFAHDMAVEVCPTPNDRVEAMNQDLWVPIIGDG